MRKLPVLLRLAPYLFLCIAFAMFYFDRDWWFGIFMSLFVFCVLIEYGIFIKENK